MQIRLRYGCIKIGILEVRQVNILCGRPVLADQNGKCRSSRNLGLYGLYDPDVPMVASLPVLLTFQNLFHAIASIPALPI